MALRKKRFWMLLFSLVIFLLIISTSVTRKGTLNTAETGIMMTPFKAENVRDTQHLQTSFHGNTQSITPHPFDYIIHPGNVCLNDTTFFVYVYSDPKNHQRRDLIRATWGNLTLYHPLKISLLFLFGESSQSEVNRALKVESQKCKDIAQESFIETYRNLTYKSIFAMKYITENCQDVKYIMKVDDDVYVNMFSVIKYLQNRIQTNSKHRMELIGLIWRNTHVLRSNSKWFVTKEEWPEEVYPPYCSGPFYMFTPDFAVAALKLSYVTRFFWLEDVYITGILANQMNVKHIDIPNGASIYLNNVFDKYKTDPKATLSWIFAHGGSEKMWEKIWKTILKQSN